MKRKLVPQIEKTIRSLDVTSIAAERKAVLQPLIDYLQKKVANQQSIRLNFICTHNSRRSHLSQIWAQTMAHHFGLEHIDCYSGGTEATALFPKVGETLQNQGFLIQKLSDTENPVYAVSYTDNEHPIIAFSKTYDDSFNPVMGFGAIMTCDSANEACPMVIGAEKRFAIMYEDPKRFDGTLQQAEKYVERSIEIATEMYYVFSKSVNQ